MTGAEFACWARHFGADYVGGRDLTNTILAHIWAGLATFMSGKTYYPHDLVPALKPADFDVKADKRETESLRKMAEQAMKHSLEKERCGRK